MDTDMLLATDLDASAEDLVRLARDPGTRADVLTALASRGDSCIDEGTSATEWLAQMCDHPNLDHRTLAVLATSSSWAVQYEVARNPKTPPELLASLVDEARTEMVLGAVARRRDCPAATLAAIALVARDGLGETTIRDLIENPSTPDDVVDQLILLDP